MFSSHIGAGQRMNVGRAGEQIDKHRCSLDQRVAGGIHVKLLALTT